QGDDLRRVSRRAFMAAAAAAAAAPALGAAGYRAPRTTQGTPDLQGIWCNASYTGLERDDAFKTLVISPQEARKAEANFARTGDFSGMVDPLGQKDSEFWDAGPGLARVRGEIRTSWIVDPPNGKLPYNAATIKRFHYDDPKWKTPLDNPEDQSVTTRCVASEGGAPPNINSPDGNYLRIVQTRDHVVLLAEKYNDLRIVRMRETAHQPAAIQSWLGDAVGRWEGETLVVDSTNLCPSTVRRTDGMKISPAGHIVERFTRISPTEIFYEFSVTDPTFYTQTWRAEMPFLAARGPMYEYACHEGNYGLPNILAGARRAEREAATAKATAPSPASQP
ncbi:MAG: hypothetical protein ACXWKN_14825, partial [Phenylobacterium sp.]